MLHYQQSILSLPAAILIIYDLRYRFYIRINRRIILSVLILMNSFHRFYLGRRLVKEYRKFIMGYLGKDKEMIED